MRERRELGVNACQGPRLSVHGGTPLETKDFRRLRSRKHGIDFLTAQALWDDPDAVEIPARTEDEARLLTIGVIDGKHWSAVTTPRQEHTRIISVRRSRDEEVEIYESARL